MLLSTGKRWSTARGVTFRRRWLAKRGWTSELATRCGKKVCQKLLMIYKNV